MNVLATTVLTLAGLIISTPAFASPKAGDAFAVTRTQVFHPENSGAVQIPADSMITVLGEMTDSRGEALVHVGIDSDEENQVATDLWIRANELETAGLKALDNGTDLEDVQTEMLNKKMTYCYRFVKQYLLKHGLTRGYLGGASAWQAKNYLPSQGFHKVGGPGSARVNDVCVYTGGNGNNGHVEIRTPSGWYYGYGYKPSPITLNNHRLISCYRK